MLRALVEIDLEDNPIQDFKQVLLAVIDKKDILVLNLKKSAVLLGSDNYDDCLNQASLLLIESTSP